MKQQLLVGLLLIGTVVGTRAGIYYQGSAFSGGTSMGGVANSTIVDGNPTIVTANTMDLSSQSLNPILSITVSLNLTGGNNNGLYAWLTGPGGTTVTLMNQPGYAVNGYGATGAGMNITLQDGSVANGSIQNVTSGSVLSGTYNAAGNLSDFNGVNPNGAWTLYFSDTIGGGGDATLNGWSLDVTPVPEPVNMAIVVFGVLAVGTGGFRNFLKQRKATSIRQELKSSL